MGQAVSTGLLLQMLLGVGAFGHLQIYKGHSDAQILVTGAAGYIGSHMALKLLGDGVKVVGVDNLSRGSQRALDVLSHFPLFKFVNLDLGDEPAVEALFTEHNFDSVIHFAAVAFVPESVTNPGLYKSNITTNTKILTDAMIRHHVQQLIYSSTCAVYGIPDLLPITEESPTRPVSPYGQAKLDAEKYIHSKASDTFRVNVLRYFNVVGADAKGRLGENPLPTLASMGRLWTACTDAVFRRRQCVELYDTHLKTVDGTAIRDYVHVEDLVRAHLAVIETPNTGNFEVWNVATNIPTSTLQFVESARRATGSFIPICFGNRTESHSPPALYASGERLRRLTGWVPQYTSIDAILTTAWKWTQQAGACPGSTLDQRLAASMIRYEGNAEKGVIFSTVLLQQGDKTGIEVVSNWYRRLQDLDVSNPLVIGVDTNYSTCGILRAHGICCYTASPIDDFTENFGEFSGRGQPLEESASAILPWRYTLEFLRRGLQVYYSGTGVYWHRRAFNIKDVIATDLNVVTGCHRRSKASCFQRGYLSMNAWGAKPTEAAKQFFWCVLQDSKNLQRRNNGVSKDSKEITRSCFAKSKVYVDSFPQGAMTILDSVFADRLADMSENNVLNTDFLKHLYGRSGSWHPRVSHEAPGPPSWRRRQYDVCIVGAGLSSAVLAERHASVYNHSVLVVEKRGHIGGNCYDYIDDETGIRVSKYGVHLFHTKFDRVWTYLQRFSRWTPWEHHCVAKVGNHHVPVPVNIDSVNLLFNLSISSEEEMSRWLSSVQVPPPHGDAVNSEEVGLQRVGKELYEMIFKPYTIKQWNKDPKELGPSVLARIPVRKNHDDRYFTDPYQALPSDGYTRIFENMFNSPRISIQLNTDFFAVRGAMQCGHTYYTGPIDTYFAAQGLPKLEYRSLEFERQVLKNTEFFQPRAHVNYPELKYNYTRIIEYKHILHQKSPHTVIFVERSTDVGEPYYPVPNSRNQNLYAKYQALATNESKLSFVGRLANYKYFNMDQTVKNALELFDEYQFHTIAVQESKSSSMALPDLHKDGLPVRIERDRGCIPGSFETASQWRKLFPNGRFPFKGKALVAIPIGSKAHDASTIDALVRSMGHDAFDYLFFAFDDTDWTEYDWYERPGVSVKHERGAKWTFYKDHLKPDVVEKYTHLFLWDDDLAPAPGFDGEGLLHLMQSLDIVCAQPMIRSNAHNIEGTQVESRNGSHLLHETRVVEVMAPVLATKWWAQCIYPRLVRDRGSGYGVDSYLFQYGDCVPPQFYAVRFPVDHLDTKSLSKKTQYKKTQQDEKDAYKADVLRRGERHHPHSPPFWNYNAYVNRSCDVALTVGYIQDSSVHTYSLLFASREAVLLVCGLSIYWLVRQKIVLNLRGFY